VELRVFAAAALVASRLLIRRSASQAVPTLIPIGTRPGSILPLAILGVLVGLLTGIAGVGGGFAIVPALVLLGGAVGAAAGQRMAPHLSDRRLRQGFAALLLGSACYRDPRPSGASPICRPAPTLMATAPARRGARWTAVRHSEPAYPLTVLNHRARGLWPEPYWPRWFVSPVCSLCRSVPSSCL